MQVKLNTIMAGPGGCFHPGSVVDVSPESAAILLASGQATAVAGKESPGTEQLADARSTIKENKKTVETWKDPDSDEPRPLEEGGKTKPRR